MKKIGLCCTVYFFILITVLAQSAELPLISELSPQNYIFQKLRKEAMERRNKIKQ